MIEISLSTAVLFYGFLIAAVIVLALIGIVTLKDILGLLQP